MAIAAIILCIPLYVINSFCDKLISVKSNKNANAIYNIVKFLIGSLILLPAFLSDSSKFSKGAVICGLTCAAMYAISKMIIMTGYENSSVSFMTLCHSSGMLLPCIIGHFAWGERLSVLSLFGIITVIISILLLKSNGAEEKKNSKVGIICGIITLITSGGVMVLQKIMGIYFSSLKVSSYNFYSFAGAFLMLLCVPKKNECIEINIGKSIICATGSAVSLCVISLVMTRIASVVPAVIMFPLFNGVGVIAVTLLSAVFFKEKITLKSGIGVIIGLLGLFLTLNTGSLKSALS